MALIDLSVIEMLSPTGRCRTFDESGDGTILSEAVGVVVLKPLRDAVGAGDHIYGVIRGSGVNQDGASNGITAPSGSAQEKLIAGVYDRHGISPEDITCIEAHGTGTELGDPVEANALARVFRRFTGKQEYCALGSAKSHIGHTGASAGVIGLIKILLSMRHHKIPGLINFKKLNPLIRLNESAFYVNTESAEWKSENRAPLTGALNSFGHSGTNVHIVVQEYISNDPGMSQIPVLTDKDSPVIIPVSAKNEDRLRECAGRLLKFLHKADPGTDLARIAYTLQTGREAMEERVAFAVENIPGLIAKLESFLKQENDIPNCFRGRVRRGSSMAGLSDPDEEFDEAVEKWIKKGKLGKIAELWSRGFETDWNKLYGDTRPRRISLPAYPFARERYWIPEGRRQEAEARRQERAYPQLGGATGNSPLEGGQGGVFSGHGRLSEYEKHPPDPPQGGNPPTHKCARQETGGRSQEPGGTADSAGSSASPGTLLARPFWKEEAADREAAAPDYARHLVMLCESGELTKADIGARMTGVCCVSLQSRDNDIAERFKNCAEQVFAEIKGIIEDKPEANVLVQVVVPTEGEHRLFSGLAGLLKTARKENPRIICQMIGSEPGAGADVTVKRLDENGRCPADTEIRYQDGTRLVAGWKEIRVSPGNLAFPGKIRASISLPGAPAVWDLFLPGKLQPGSVMQP